MFTCLSLSVVIDDASWSDFAVDFESGPPRQYSPDAQAFC